MSNNLCSALMLKSLSPEIKINNKQKNALNSVQVIITTLLSKLSEIRVWRAVFLLRAKRMLKDGVIWVFNSYRILQNAVLSKKLLNQNLKI